MAWTYSLISDDATIALNGGDYSLLVEGFRAPPPRRLRHLGGVPLLPSARDVLADPTLGRTVTVRLRIKASDNDTLIGDLNALHGTLSRAEEFSRIGLGSQVKLRRQWDGATNSVDFHVVRGDLNVGDTELSIAHEKGKTLFGVTLTLLCKPFAYGAQETVSNYVKDPSFEIAGTALADWTEDVNATGTTARSTEQSKYGDASLKLVMTDSSGVNQKVAKLQRTPAGSFAEGDVVSVAVWSLIEELTDARSEIECQWEDAANGVIGGLGTAFSTTEGADWVQLATEGSVAPANTDHIVIRINIRSLGAGSTGTVYQDGVMVVKAASLPSAFMSGRSIVNHFDDDGQAHINYVDLYDVPGDVPASCQVKIAENETHTDVWVGARHAGRLDDGSIFLEGEDGTTTAVRTQADTDENTDEAEADANASGGNSNRNQIRDDGTGGANWSTDDTWFRTDWTISAPLPKGQYRVLIRCANGGDNAGAATESDFLFGVGWKYGAVTLLDQTNPDTASFVALTAHGGGAPGLDTAGIYQLLDLGTITIPPILTPDGQTDADFILQIYQYLQNGDASAPVSDTIEWYIDYVLLVPIDQGAAYISKTSGQDVVLVDSLSQPGGAWLLNTSDVVQSFPTNQFGSPILLHPDGTRLYFAFHDTAPDAVITDGAVITVTYQPLYLLVRGDD